MISLKTVDAFEPGVFWYFRTILWSFLICLGYFYIFNILINIKITKMLSRVKKNQLFRVGVFVYFYF